MIKNCPLSPEFIKKASAARKEVNEMTVERQPKKTDDTQPHHMTVATENALRLIARWQAEGKLTPDNKLTRSQVRTKFSGAYFDALDDPVVSSRTPTGEIVQGVYEKAQD